DTGSCSTKAAAMRKLTLPLICNRGAWQDQMTSSKHKRCNPAVLLWGRHHCLWGRTRVRR
ncbi:MAG: hypothetical protein KGL95_15580, partial [Patescibacteria group bacterium]|nr:hypothetical protein [Patescibacteria group bacterium]